MKSPVQTQLNFKQQVLPWFGGLYNGRKQSSTCRVVELCPELLSAVDNRLLMPFKCPLLLRNEILVELTDRGGRMLLVTFSIGIQFEPENGCHDEDLARYKAIAIPLTSLELADMLLRTSDLDIYLQVP